MAAASFSPPHGGEERDYPIVRDLCAPAWPIIRNKAELDRGSATARAFHGRAPPEAIFTHQINVIVAKVVGQIVDLFGSQRPNPTTKRDELASQP
jgi:hypothetical protein